MNLHNIMEKIERSRLKVNAHHIVQLVAVSKYSNSNQIKELYKEGQRAFGENKVQDLEEKSNELNELPIEWHFLGNLQKNKINKLIELSPSLIQSVSSFDLALELQKRLEAKNTTIDALLQINSAKEATKGGVQPEDAKEIYQKIKDGCPKINLQGVMTIGAHSDDRKIIKNSFETTFKIYENLKSSGALICSMGMSSDFELAIECGSNMVRLGSILFKDN
ncbi:MAG: dependent protein [Campylobacterota bacterium]|nr:dependent protein [Campylobacterota bacterium]